MATVETENRKNLIEANAEYAASRPRKAGKLKRLPQKRYLIVTCMDARIDPVEAFGIDPGDAHIIRNAGGSARAALRDIIFSLHLLGTKEVFIIKHHECEVQDYASSTDVFSQLYPGKIKCAGAASIADVQFHVFACPYAATREDRWFLQNHPAVADGLVVHGFVYNPARGTLDGVEPQAAGGPQDAPPASQPNRPNAPAPTTTTSPSPPDPQPSPPPPRRPRTPPRTPLQSAAMRAAERAAAAAATITTTTNTGRKRAAASRAGAAPRKKAVSARKVAVRHVNI